ncbi:MAG: rRNA maturation RNase YbeY [Campylobacterota bacterium]
MIDIENNTSLKIDEVKLEKIANEVTNKDIELIVTNNINIQSLNKEHRNIDKPTDVLSFPLEFDLPNMPVGSIVISEDFVKEKSKEYGHTNQEEFFLLFIHGVLHLIGYDHEIDNGEHRDKEEELINKFNLPKSLIVRNS